MSLQRVRGHALVGALFVAGGCSVLGGLDALKGGTGGSDGGPDASGTGATSSGGGNAGASGGGGVSGDSGACSMPPSSCTPAITPQNFHVAWTTPNEIRFAWDPAGNAAEFGGYELWVAKSETDAVCQLTAAQGGTALLFDGTKNPELGVYDFLYTGGNDETRATSADDLDPNTQYYAVLVARDTSGCESRLPASGALKAPLTHPEPQYQVPLFDDTQPANGSLSADSVFVASSQECEGGAGACLRSADCAILPCWRNVGFFDLQHSLSELTSQGFNASAFDSLAIAELYVRSDAQVASYWANVWLDVGVESAPGAYDNVYRIEPYSLRNDNGWQRIQIPLSALHYGSAMLSYADLENAADPHAISGFNAGGSVGTGTHLWVDRVSIRW